MKLLLLLIAVFICTAIHCQSYDSTNFVKCQIIKIERSMLVGNWITIQADNGEIRYAIKHYMDRKTQELIGQCILIGKDHWLELKTTKR